MPFGSLRPSPLVEQAAERLRTRITSGQWPVGTRLPAETALAEALGVGRSTVREALRALAGAGLLRTRQGAGVFVIADHPREDWPARLCGAADRDVHEARALLELPAARMAAARRTPEDIAALHSALAAWRAAAARTSRGTRADGHGLDGHRRHDRPLPTSALDGHRDHRDPGPDHHRDPGHSQGPDHHRDADRARGPDRHRPTRDDGDRDDGHDRRPDPLLDADLALHAAVVAAAGNPVLGEVFTALTPAVRQCLAGAAGPRGPGADEAHTALVAAIARGDGYGASRHLRAELDALAEPLRARGSTGSGRALG